MLPVQDQKLLLVNEPVAGMTRQETELTAELLTCMCLMGRNGVGKTTLLKCIMGLEKIKFGEILFKGNKFSGKPAKQRARYRISYMPQGREIFPQLTVDENLRTGLLACAGRKTSLPPLIFELFPVLKEMLKRKGGDLSGGQQQQLALGRALALEPYGFAGREKAAICQESGKPFWHHGKRSCSRYGRNE